LFDLQFLDILYPNTYIASYTISYFDII